MLKFLQCALRQAQDDSTLCNNLRVSLLLLFSAVKKTHKPDSKIFIASSSLYSFIKLFNSFFN